VVIERPDLPVIAGAAAVAQGEGALDDQSLPMEE
jgi:hypothetical protein